MRNSLLFLALCGTALVAGAQGAPATGATGTYACGGVGDFEQRQFKNAAAQHDAMLTVATPSGAYVSDVDVKITSAKGDVVLQVFCDGPLMLADLPATGRYRIAAGLNGQWVEKTVDLGDRHARVLFTWPAS